MHTKLDQISKTSPVHPLSQVELVSNDNLHRLAKGGPERAYGEISSEDQRLLAMSLPDICGELMAYRAAARVELPLPYSPARNHYEEIENARALADAERAERIEALAQANCDDLAEVNARLQEIMQQQAGLGLLAEQILRHLSEAMPLPDRRAKA